METGPTTCSWTCELGAHEKGVRDESGSPSKLVGSGWGAGSEGKRGYLYRASGRVRAEVHASSPGRSLAAELSLSALLRLQHELPI